MSSRASRSSRRPRASWNWRREVGRRLDPLQHLQSVPGLLVALDGGELGEDLLLLRLVALVRLVAGGALLQAGAIRPGALKRHQGRDGVGVLAVLDQRLGLAPRSRGGLAAQVVRIARLGKEGGQRREALQGLGRVPLRRRGPHLGVGVDGALGAVVSGVDLGGDPGLLTGAGLDRALQDLQVPRLQPALEIGRQPLEGGERQVLLDRPQRPAPRRRQQPLLAPGDRAQRVLGLEIVPLGEVEAPPPPAGRPAAG